MPNNVAILLFLLNINDHEKLKKRKIIILEVKKNQGKPKIA